MKTKFFALLCALALLVSAVPAASALEGEAERSADILATLGLVQGNAAGEYDLDAPATRAQAAVMLVRLAGAQEDARADIWIAGYLDLPAWAADFINYAAHQGWVSGATQVKYNPNGQIDAGDWYASLLRMLGYSDQDGAFTLDYAAIFARRIGLASISYDGLMTRGDLFLSIRDALTFPYKDGSGTVLDHLLEQGKVSRATANALGLLTTELSARQVADRYLSAVFRLDNYRTQKAAEAGESDAHASGFFISADGIAVTNYHSIEGAVAATAELVTGETFPVERVLYYDAGIDIAVIQVSRTSTSHQKTSAFAYLDIAPSGTKDVRVGDTVYTISNPLGLGLAVSSGVVSDTARAVARYDLPCLMDTADISQGSSGGALLNAYGQVIGVTSGAFTYGNNMYLAVPIDPVLSADLTGEGWTIKQVRDIMKQYE